MLSLLAVASLAVPLLSSAQQTFNPTAPGPNDSFKPGAPCSISWDADTSGKWKQTFIELMTGPNQQMIHLATVGTVDGTDPTKTTFSFPCPSVTPNSAIYFYQFTAAGQNTTWTGRFAITDASGATTQPPNAKQPDGSPIPWGPGKLLDASQGSPPPPTAPAGQIDGSGGSGAGSASGSSVSPASSVSGSTPNAPSSIPPTTTAQATASSSPSAATPSSISTVRGTPATTAIAAAASSSTASAPTQSSAAISSYSASALMVVIASLLGFMSL